MQTALRTLEVIHLLHLALATRQDGYGNIPKIVECICYRSI